MYSSVIMHREVFGFLSVPFRTPGQHRDGDSSCCEQTWSLSAQNSTPCTTTNSSLFNSTLSPWYQMQTHPPKCKETRPMVMTKPGASNAIPPTRSLELDFPPVSSGVLQTLDLASKKMHSTSKDLFAWNKELRQFQYWRPSIPRPWHELGPFLTAPFKFRPKK